MRDLEEVLKYIPPGDLDYSEWIQVGMALKNEGYDCSVWDSWSSQGDPRYVKGVCEAKWKTFGSHPSPVTAGTIVKMARDRGMAESPQGSLDWDSEIAWEYEPDDPDLKQSRPSELKPTEQLILYLKTLFAPDDYVSYVTDVFKGKDGRYSPTRGTFNRTAGDLIKDLKKYPDDLGAAIGDWKEEAGAWIRFNPVDGYGIKNENISAFRYTLVESDTMSIEQQQAAYARLELPVAAMVLSGGKSLHAIVRVDAKNFDEYRKRVDFLYRYCSEKGLKLDTQNKNPSRLSRLPGVTRNGRLQELVAVNTGKASWDEWTASLGEYDDGLPPFVSWSEVEDDPPELLPELIEGVLRRGHKMIISGSSKAGKSFLLIELCIAIAEGTEWLGFKCKKGKVLYVNLEIDPASCMNRIKRICEALDIKPEHSEDLVVWNLRGRAMELKDLVPKLVRRIKGKGFDAVILDPIYKVIMGDENNASDMGKFCNEFDKICEQTGASAIYCHHHSKGYQGEKRALDRASGSGVFARDPDAQLDMIQLELSEETRNTVLDGNETAWRLEGNLREFRNFRPRNFWFRYPLHVLDVNGDLNSSFPEGSRDSNLAKGKKRNTPATRRELVDIAYDALSLEPVITTKMMAEYLNVQERTVRNYINGDYPDKYFVKNGIVLLSNG